MEGLPGINGKRLISFRGVYACQATLTSSCFITALIESPSTILTAFARIISSAEAATERGKATRLEQVFSSPRRVLSSATHLKKTALPVSYPGAGLSDSPDTPYSLAGEHYFLHTRSSTVSPIVPAITFVTGPSSIEEDMMSPLPPY